MTFRLTNSGYLNCAASGRGIVLRRGGVFLMIVLLLSACAGSQPFRDGNALLAAGKTDEGLAKLEEAVRAEPSNAEYRIVLYGRRATVVNGLIDTAEAARREGRLDDAEKAYVKALRYEPANAMATQGMAALTMERRHRKVLAEIEASVKQGANYADSLERIRRILADNPKQKDALRLKAQIEEAQAKEVKPDGRLAAAYRKPISLEFRDAPLRSVFDILSQVSGLNFFFDNDIRADAKATILVKNTSIENAIHMLLVTTQLEQKILNENSILIYPATPQKLKDYQTLSVRTFYLANADVKAVSNTLKTIVKTKDMVVDERLGLIIMRDTPEAIRIAERIIALEDLSDPEVMLEVEILEINRSRMLELGIQWPDQVSLAPVTVTGGAPLTLQGLAHLTSAQTQATIGSVVASANIQDQYANLLANPRIRVRNKEKAKILVGERVPVFTTTAAATGFAAESVNYLDVGLKLEVEPSIYLDEEVGIKINLEVSTLGSLVTSPGGSQAYQISTRNANTVLRLKDGETQVLAGLINDQDTSAMNKLPGLGDIPILNLLFGSTQNFNQRNEILLSITPHIIRSVRRTDLLSAEFESGTESSLGGRALRLSPDEKSAEPKSTGAVAPVPATAAASTDAARSNDSFASQPVPMFPGGSSPSPSPSVSPSQANPAESLPSQPVPMFPGAGPPSSGTGASPSQSSPAGFVPSQPLQVFPGATPTPSTPAQPTPARTGNQSN